MLKKIEIEKEFTDLISAEIPANLIKQKPGQGDLKYISGCMVIDILNKLTNYNWDWTIDHCWKETSEDKFNPKYDKEPKPQGPVAHVIGTLTIYMKDENDNIISIKKQAAGAKPVIGGQNEQKDIFKSASTDALKKAASLLGIGAQLYRDEDEQEYFENLCYEDPWTDEILNEHQHEFDYIKKLITDNTVSRKELSEIVSEWSSDTYTDVNDLLPKELTDFVNYLKEQLEVSESTVSE